MGIDFNDIKTFTSKKNDPLDNRTWRIATGEFAYQADAFLKMLYHDYMSDDPAPVVLKKRRFVYTSATRQNNGIDFTMITTKGDRNAPSSRNALHFRKDDQQTICCMSASRGYQRYINRITDTMVLIPVVANPQASNNGQPKMPDVHIDKLDIDGDIDGADEKFEVQKDGCKICFATRENIKCMPCGHPHTCSECL